MQKKNSPDQTTEETYTADQTQFSSEEPLYEAVSLPSDPDAVMSSSVAPQKKLSPQKMIVIALGVGAVILLLLLGLATLMQEPTAVETALPSPSVEPASADAMQQRITTLRKQVLSADPSLDTLPLPPVDLELRLEK